MMTLVQAKMEANRCLMCSDSPCACDCPAGVNPRAFIRKIRFDNLTGAVRLLKESNVLAGSCAYICPTGSACAKACTTMGLSRPIDIGGLQRFVMDWERETGMIEPSTLLRNGAKIAVIGAGPAGLGCAAELAIRGYIVTVFEKTDAVGGMPRHCIPSFRLPTEVIDFEVEFLKRLGIEFVFNTLVEDPRRFLSEGYKAVFVATGLDRPELGEILGTTLPDVCQALDILKLAKQGNLPNLGRRAVVIGGGDTALDAARVVRRQGFECFILYRRTQKEMPAYPEEIAAAWDEGVEFYFRVIVRAVVGKDKVEGARCVRIRWHDPMPGMPRGYDVEGTEFTVVCDTVILAMGQGPAASFGLRTTPKGLLAAHKDTMMTSEAGIFAGGDVAFGGGTAARAVGHGKLAAMKIDEYVSKT